MIFVCFQGKPFNTMVFQAYAPTSNTEDLKLQSSMKTYKTFFSAYISFRDLIKHFIKIKNYKRLRLTVHVCEINIRGKPVYQNFAYNFNKCMG